jgi:hypothetical protein
MLSLGKSIWPDLAKITVAGKEMYMGWKTSEKKYIIYVVTVSNKTLLHSLVDGNIPL